MATSKKSRMVAVDVETYRRLKFLSGYVGCSIKNIADYAIREYLSGKTLPPVNKGFNPANIIKGWFKW